MFIPAMSSFVIKAIHPQWIQAKLARITSSITILAATMRFLLHFPAYFLLGTALAAPATLSPEPDSIPGPDLGPYKRQVVVPHRDLLTTIGFRTVSAVSICQLPTHLD